MQKSFTIKMVQQRQILGRILLSFILLMLKLDEINISMILLGEGWGHGPGDRLGGGGCLCGLRFYLEKFISRPKSTTNFYNQFGGKISSLKISILVISTQNSQLLSCPREILASVHNEV